MKSLFFLSLSLASFVLHAQELFPYAEPASNMPSHSIALRNLATFQRDANANKISQRYIPEAMFGLSKTWMLHTALSFSNMHQPSVIWEGARFYAKYRFYSADEVHKHFRMALFGMAAYSRNDLNKNEINLYGDQSGVEGGIIATQLWNKFAVSGTAGWNEVLSSKRSDKVYADRYAFQALNYSLSTGYLLLPFKYKNYNQTNLNFYLELLGSRNLNLPREKYYVDVAPSVQAIFRSTTKLSLGYRFQLSSDIDRLAKNSVTLNFEYIFLNALGRKSSLPQR